MQLENNICILDYITKLKIQKFNNNKKKINLNDIINFCDVNNTYDWDFINFCDVNNSYDLDFDNNTYIRIYNKK
jgi:hypothetical protein